MADETDSDKKIASLQMRVFELERKVEQLISAAKNHAVGINALNKAVPRMMIRR